MPKTYLVTGGAGFIGSNFVHYLLWHYKDAVVVNVDALTYAGNLENIADIADNPRHIFIHADICDQTALEAAFGKYGPDYVVNFAAQSHVDRAIDDPYIFEQANVQGILSLMDAAGHDWEEPDGSFGDHVFLQVSSDEVYGSRNAATEAPFAEDSPLAPSNPYSASKAAAEHYAMSFANTYGFPVMIVRCCNNYGPYQHPEKLIPKTIASALAGRDICLYGDGRNMRDWIYVADTCRAIDMVLQNGRLGEAYNISANCERQNTDIVAALADELACQTGDTNLANCPVRFVQDRPGHDTRYGIDSSKLRRELDWHPSTDLQSGISKTVYWYLNHQDWTARILANEVQSNNELLLEQWEAREQEAKKQARKDAQKEAKAQKREARRHHGKHAPKP